MEKIYSSKNRTELPEKPILTSLSFSGGKQSSCLLWMVILGDIPKPDNFVVLNADPGMENSQTYVYVEMMKKKCEEVGIEFYTVEGPNLYKDLLNFYPKKPNDRVDNPPYWTKSAEGKRGRLLQKCTQVYKIYPMKRHLRKLLEEKFNIPQKTKRIKRNCVEQWIGFSYDEVQRIKPPDVYYTYFRYPLIELKLKTEQVIQYFKDKNLPLPPRSVCNACFANGLETFKQMSLTQPDDFKQAIDIDKSLLRWSGVYTRDEVYISNTLVRLEDLAKTDFVLPEDDTDEYSCDSGFCFT